MIVFSTAHRSTSARLTKAALWLCTILFVLGLTASLSHQHQHDAADDLLDCVTCHVGANAHAVMPAAPAELLAIFLIVLYLAARRPQYVNVVPLRYLIPSRQAPPVLMS